MKHHIEALTTTRAIAALMVVVFHYGCTVFPFNLQEHFFRQGNLAVSYFYVLSGFVMYLSYVGKDVGYGDFMKRRVARIWPLYTFAILLAIAYPLYKYFSQGVPLINNYGKAIALNLGFLQAYVPGYALTVNSPGWSLSVEMFFYLLFPFLLWYSKRNGKGFMIITLVFFVLSQLHHHWLIANFAGSASLRVHDYIYYQPMFHLNTFMIGIVAGQYARVTTVKPHWLLTLLLTMLVVLLVNFIPGKIDMHNGLLAPMYALLIISIARQQSVVLSARPLVFLGEISFGIYILQEPLHFYMTKWDFAMQHLDEAAFFYFYLLMLVFVSTLCYYVIERPLRVAIAGK